VRELMALNR